MEMCGQPVSDIALSAKYSSEITGCSGFGGQFSRIAHSHLLPHARRLRRHFRDENLAAEQD
jgi:hypothetical protein